MNATFRLLAGLLRKIPASVLLLVAEQAVAWFGKRGRPTTCNQAAASSSVDQPDPLHNFANDGRP